MTIPGVKIRTFLAIPIPRPVIDRLADLINTLRKNGSFPEAKWSRPDQIHMTVKFFGDVESHRIPLIIQKIGNYSMKFRSYSMLLDYLDAFPDRRQPRVLWIGVRRIPEDHHNLIDSLEQVSTELGFAPDKKSAIPHLTLARIRHPKPVKWPDDSVCVKIFDNIPCFHINSIQLLASNLSPTGATYQLLNEVFF
ncbi:RNA 2',3'-cyclic phosphodiesterase [bacterium]|nr:RNA 2',3'-cyclic phosphodiesterase [candidate division CSSED10-310 bacterium]